MPELAEGEAALKEALPLAEALDEVALDSRRNRAARKRLPKEAYIGKEF